MRMVKNAASLFVPSYTQLKAMLPEKDQMVSQHDLKHSLAMGSGKK